MSAEWLIPALGFVLLEGALGITTKLALNHIPWRQLLLWTACAYAVLASALVVIAGERLPFGAGAEWAALSGVFASMSLLTFFVALDRGDASRVVPVTAGYPVVTAVLAALVLSEEISAVRGLGTFLVVTGIVWLGHE